MPEVYGDDERDPGAGESGAERVEVRRREGGDAPTGASPLEGLFGAAGGAGFPFGAGLKMPLNRRPSSRIGSVALVLACLCFFLPGFFAIPPVDRDESRFAQASRQMFESVSLPPSLRDPARHGGGLVVPMVQDRPRLNKPPLIYWLQAGSAAVFTGGNPFRDRIWMYRVPSLIAGIIAALALYHLGSRMFDRKTGWLAGLLLAGCPVVAWEAHQARADMVLLAFTTVTMAALYRVASSEARPPWRDALVFWIALAGGIMTKGPITPMVALFGAVAYSIGMRRWGWWLGLRPLLGILIVAACIGPWVGAVSRHVGWETYIQTVRDEVLGRSLVAKEGHWAPPGYHLVLLPVLFWPGSLLTAAGMGVAWRAVREWRRGGVRVVGAGGAEGPGPVGAYLYCIAWIVPAWVVFELAGTKLPHYTMPLYPAVALLSARAVLLAQGKVLAPAGRGARLGFGVWGVIGAALLAAACGAVVLLRFTGMVTPVDAGAVAGGVVGLLVLLLAGRSLMKALAAVRAGSFVMGQLGAVLAFLLVAFAIFRVALPRAMALSSDIIAEARRIDPAQARPLAAAGFHEDSLIYLTRGRIARVDDGAAWLEANPRGLLIAPAAGKGALAEGSRWPVLASAKGLAYATRAHVETLTVRGEP
jgi:4-amino-4-deoxy-L-arabinose transferase-like glycosyltransferase